MHVLLNTPQHWSVLLQRFVTRQYSSLEARAIVSALCTYNLCCAECIYPISTRKNWYFFWCKEHSFGVNRWRLRKPPKISSNNVLRAKAPESICIEIRTNTHVYAYWSVDLTVQFICLTRFGTVGNRVTQYVRFFFVSRLAVIVIDKHC